MATVTVLRETTHLFFYRGCKAQHMSDGTLRCMFDSGIVIELPSMPADRAAFDKAIGEFLDSVEPLIDSQ